LFPEETGGYPQKILIDAGHIPGWNPADNGYVEGNRMWDLQNLIVEELQSIGFANAQRLRTRNERIVAQNPGETPNDWNLRDNEERGKRAAGFDLFIQLHTNAATRLDASHAVVYYPMDGRNDTQALGNSFADTIKIAMGLSENSHIVTSASDGVEAFRVMRGAHSVNCPRYFITENGFHTTSSTTLWLMQDSNLRRLARAYAEVIRDLFS
jgi:N-acetylmuramoyl-L-alanine amidase